MLALGETHREAVLILDDLAARRYALSLGSEVRGTLWLVAEAKRTGMIASATDVIADLARAGLYLPPALIAQVLKSVGEG